MESHKLKKKLFLHLGFHKTATSSFQETCKNNISEIKSQGFGYPMFPRLIDNKYTVYIENHSFPLYSMFSSQSEDYHINIWWEVDNVKEMNKQYFDYFSHFLNSHENVILSAEDISLLDENDLTKMLKYFESFGFDVYPFAAIRSPYQYHCSSIQQWVKMGYYIDFSCFQSQIEKLELMRKVFKNEVRFFSFSDMCDHANGPVGYLLCEVGVDMCSIAISKSNEGGTDLSIRTQNTLNKFNPKHIGSRQDYFCPIISGSKLNPKFNRIDFDRYEGSKFSLNTEEFANIRSCLEAENDYFREVFGENYCDKSYQKSGLGEISLETAVDSFPEILGLSFLDSYASTLRDVALEIEHKSIPKARVLMDVAAKIRPHGTFILNKLESYKSDI